MPASDLNAKFQQQGYLHLPGLLTADEAQHYRAALEAEASATASASSTAGNHAGGWTLPDGVSRRRAFWPLAVHPRVVEAARSVLGPDAKYLKHTDLHVGFSGGGWHRDNVHRTFGQGSDWQQQPGKYQILRVGIYFQSYQESRFALGVVPGSHRTESKLT